MSAAHSVYYLQHQSIIALLKLHSVLDVKQRVLVIKIQNFTTFFLFPDVFFTLLSPSPIPGCWVYSSSSALLIYVSFPPIVPSWSSYLRLLLGQSLTRWSTAPQLLQEPPNVAVNFESEGLSLAFTFYIQSVIVLWALWWKMPFLFANEACSKIGTCALFWFWTIVYRVSPVTAIKTYS